MSPLQVGVPGGMELAVLLLLLVVAVPVYLGYRLLRPSADGEAGEPDLDRGATEVGGVRVGLTRNQWKLAGLFTVLVLFSAFSGGTVGGLAGMVGIVTGAVLMVWIPVMLVRLGRAGWGLASGAIRS